MRDHIALRWGRRKGLCINARPMTDLNVRVFAVVRGPVERVDFSAFEGVDDDLLVEWNAGVEKTAPRPSGETVCRRFGFHSTVRRVQFEATVAIPNGRDPM